MARQPMQMNERPPMPDMTGANDPMSGQSEEAVKQAAMTKMNEPSAEIAAVLVARLSSMTEEQLERLDDAITPEAAKVLVMLLPELRELIQAIQGGGSAPQDPRQQEPQMGALGGMS